MRGSNCICMSWLVGIYVQGCLLLALTADLLSLLLVPCQGNYWVNDIVGPCTYSI